MMFVDLQKAVTLLGTYDLHMNGNESGEIEAEFTRRR
jgi:hypothetical protein